MRKRLPTKRNQRRQHSVGRGEQLEDRRLLASDLLAGDAPGWAFDLTSAGDVVTSDVRVGPDGSVFLHGGFLGTVDFDPTADTHTITSINDSVGDGFIANYSPARELNWIQTYVSGGGVGRANDIDFDDAGNIYLAGEFGAEIATFGETTLTNTVYYNSSGTRIIGFQESYIAKLDPGGNFLWAKSWGGEIIEHVTSLSVEGDGTIHVVGSFNSPTADFDPGPGTHILTTTLDPEAGYVSDGYLLNLDSDGNFQSVVQMSGTVASSSLNTVTDNEGNLYLSGSFTETAEIGSVSLTSTGDYDAFLMKMSPTGTTEWVRQVNGELRTLQTRIGFDGDGGIYFTGYFKGTIDFGTGTPSLTSAGSNDSFVTKWDTTGNMLWSGQIAGLVTNRVLDMQFDGDKNPYFLGYFNGDVDFNFASETEQLSDDTESNNDLFVLKLASSDGSIRHLTQIENDAASTASYSSIAADERGNIYVSGDIKGGTFLLPTGDAFTIIDTRDAFLMKLNMAPGISVTRTQGLVTSETGSTASFDVVLDIPPTDDVTINLTSSNTNEGTVSPASLTFTPANWNVVQTVSVTGVDDGVLDGDVAYTIAATATSADLGYNGLDAADVIVTNLDNEQPVIHELLNDSFEVAEWNGVWVEDSQNDWKRSTQRKSDGSYSAEIDGRATDATLTLANAIDLTNYSTAELTFSWYIESGFDTNEYIALDFFDGSNWNEVASLKGNVDQENTWHHESITIDGNNLVDDFKIRFRSKVSSSREDGFVDNVKIMGTLGAVNAAPVANNDGSYSVNEDSILTVTAAGILANDADAEDDPLSAILVSAPAKGALSLNANGSFTYTPNADFNGSDSFTYMANDGSSNSNTATVSISVAPINDAPTATDDNYTIDQDTDLNISAAGVLSNDSDIDGDPITVVLPLAREPSYGTVAVDDNGSFIYSPTPGFFGSDSFDYIANDGSIDSNVATVSITVNRINNVPVAADDAYSVDEDNLLTVDTASGVLLSNDSDPDGDPLTAVFVSGPSDGALTLNADGSFTYAPNAHFNGTDSFTYKADDGFGESSVATVTITVNSINDAPVAGNESYSVDQDSVLNVAASGVLSNDSDADWDALGAEVVSGPSSGSLTLNPDGSFSYSPSVGFAGSDSFTYVANDGSTNSNIATVSITVTAISSTKFYVVDNTSDSTYEYEADGSHVTNYKLGTGNNSPKGAAATAAGDTLWVIDNDDHVYVHDNDGNLLREWKATGLSRPEGIATDGTDVWIVDRGNDRVHYFAGGATRTSDTSATSSFSLVAGNPRGITTDGTSLWVVDTGTDDVYKYKVDGKFLGSWALDSRNTVPRGITINPAVGNDIWVVDSTDDAIYHYAGAASRISGSQPATTVINLASGNTNPQGIADPPPQPTSLNSNSSITVPLSNEIFATADWSTQRSGSMDTNNHGSPSYKTRGHERTNAIHSIETHSEIVHQLASVNESVANVASSPESEERLQSVDEFFANDSDDLLVDDLLDGLF